MNMDNETQRVLEKLDDLKDSVQRLDKRIEVGFAELPIHFVTRHEYDVAKKEMVVTRRWTAATVLSVVGIIVANWPI